MNIRLTEFVDKRTDSLF